MNFFLIISLFIFTSLAHSQPLQHSHASFANSENLKLTRSDHVAAEHMVSIIKLIEKGDVKKETIKKSIKEIGTNKNFQLFVPWLHVIQEISNFTKTSDLIVYCTQHKLKKETFNLEKVITRIAGNFCREKALLGISKDIEKNKMISDDATQFIQENLKSYLTKKNKKNFAAFIQAQTTNPEVLKKISQEVTTFSVLHNIVPSQEVLKDILINEQITKLIQDRGFSLVQTQNVFYLEFGKLIEQGYKGLDTSTNDKVKEHFTFMKNYIELNQDHLPVGLCLTRLNDFAKSVFRANFKDLSRNIFKYIVTKNNKEIQEDALFFYLWTHLSQNEFKEALALAGKHDLLNDKTKILDPRLKFWIAYLFEVLNDPKKSLPYYEDIVFNNPLSYYAIMAVKKIKLINNESPVVSFYSDHTTLKSEDLSFDSKLLTSDFHSSLIRLKAWAKIDSQRLIKIEVKRLRLHSIPDFLVNLPTDKQTNARSDLHLINARLILDSRNYLSTFRYLYEALEKKEVIFNRALLEILYPRPYLDDVARALKKDTLDPIIPLSLIRQESVFNPLARSPVGARGLMQLMPATARRLRRSVRDKHLVNPGINIELGTKYFKGLMKRYDGNLVYVLAAYNAGEGRVERWKDSLFDSDATILKNIESIPFLETRNYVKLIFRNIFFYKLLLNKNGPNDSTEPNKIYDVNLGFKH